MMAATIALPAGSGQTTAVCATLNVSRASVHRHRVALAAPLFQPYPLTLLSISSFRAMKSLG